MVARQVKAAAKPAKPAAAVGKTSARSTPAAVPAAKATRGRAKADKIDPAPARKAAIAASAPTPTVSEPKLSKGELRDLVEKHEGTIAILRSKSRETNKAAKAANKRISELEGENAELQERVAGLMAAKPEKDEPASARRATLAEAKAAPAKVAKAKPGRKPSRKGIDPGDGVPPGVAVEEAEPLDEEAEAVKTALEENLTAE